MSRLQQIKESFNRGRMKIEDIKFMIDRIDALNAEIKDYELTVTRAHKEINELKGKMVR
jgi:chromosome segregation ATPase